MLYSDIALTDTVQIQYDYKGIPLILVKVMLCRANGIVGSDIVCLGLVKIYICNADKGGHIKKNMKKYDHAST